MSEYKVITFFGGSQFDKTSQEYAETILIGKFLAEKGYTVSSGGYFGLMEAVSKGAQEVGGNTIGCLCDDVHKTSIGNDYLKYRFRNKTICSRLETLTEDTELFVVQKGSVGTLAEIMLVINIVTLSKSTDIKMFVLGSLWKKVLLDIFNELGVYYDFIIFCDDYNDFEIKFNTLM